MKTSSNFLSFHITKRTLVLLAILASSVIGFLGYDHYILSQNLALIEYQFATTTARLNLQIKNLSKSLVSEKQKNSELIGNLSEEQAKNGIFLEQVKQIQGTVGTLVKLSKTDPELLKKYSKVYFLNENYIPTSLSLINEEYLWNPKNPIRIKMEVAPFLHGLLTAATNEMVKIEVVSGYRSFQEQTSLKNTYKITYGSGANAFSADQGYSEHKLGTTVDLTTPGIGGNLLGFDKESAYKWLLENAYKYGFILSYPKQNSYYKFEPWHWRFVGIKLASKIHNENKYFYNLDQREIETYFISLFDY